MPPKKQPPVQQTAIGDGNVQVAGDNNTVNIIQKFFNIFKSDAETVDQRNRRIMLGHVENFWVKGILEKSLHGAALLELGIKEDPDALTYPWAIKREATKETLPAGTSMLEIFQEIGMGRSLLILGAPGSGKTTMLLELARQLIERAREDVTEPIPVVFNLSSWTQKLTLADWLARELNTIYYVPKKVAPTWIKENKMLLLLDGLDEVQQESRGKCVNAINQFRKEHGLTSIVVCSRNQNYAELKTRLTFDGAIEIQPLTSKQVDEYFKNFNKELAGIRKVLKKDTVLREMAETPLLLSIMTLAYRDVENAKILVSENVTEQRKHLFDTFFSHMFERSSQVAYAPFTKPEMFRYLQWLAGTMNKHNVVSFQIESVQPKWLESKVRSHLYRISYVLIFGGIIGLGLGLFNGANFGLDIGLGIGFVSGLASVIFSWLNHDYNIYVVDSVRWSWNEARNGLRLGLRKALIFGLIGGLGGWVMGKLIGGLGNPPFIGFIEGLATVMSFMLMRALSFGLSSGLIEKTIYPGQHLRRTLFNTVFVGFIYGLGMGLIIFLLFAAVVGPIKGLSVGLGIGLSCGLIISMLEIGKNLLKHFVLRIFLARYHLLPWRYISFLNYAVDLIFLRRIGGSYIFVHRLLMEHFETMQLEE